MGEAYRGIAVVFVWAMTTLIAVVGAVAGLRALSGTGGTGEAEAFAAVAESDLRIPRPPATNAIVLAPPIPTTTRVSSVTVEHYLPTTLVTPDFRRSPVTTPPSSPAPPPPASPPPASPPPASPPPASPPPPTAPPPTTAAPPPTTVAPLQVVTYELTGGWVRVVITDTAVNLDGAGPSDGFAQEIHNPGPSRVAVRFVSSDHISLFEVAIVRGEVEVSVSESGG